MIRVPPETSVTPEQLAALCVDGAPHVFHIVVDVPQIAAIAKALEYALDRADLSHGERSDVALFLQGIGRAKR